MQAIVYDEYGPPSVLQLRDVEEPEVGETDVLVRVRAAAANPLDWFAFTGTPYIARPGFGLTKATGKRLGADFAGVVEKIGSNVTRYKPGDEVYGTSAGSFAELVSVGEDVSLAPKPTLLSFEQAAAVPVAALDRPSGVTGQRLGRGGATCPGERGGRRGGHLHGPDRQSLGSRSDGGVQRPERGDGGGAGCGPGGRLHQ